MAKVIGIDLGTTNSCMAVIEGGEPTVIPNAEGGRTTPSVVAFTKDGQRLVGAPAKRQQVTNPENTIFSIKRFMGRKFDEVSEEMKIVPYEVVHGPERRRARQGGRQGVRAAGDQRDDPAEAEGRRRGFLGEPVTDAVITVPAYFNNAQREATKDAGKIAGLERPAHRQRAHRGRARVRSREGGGPDDPRLRPRRRHVRRLRARVRRGRVRGERHDGDNHLGGDNFDKALVDWMVAEFKNDQGIDLAADRMALQRLYEAAEKAKIELSSTMTTQINLPFVTATPEGPKHLDLTADAGEARRADARPARAHGRPDEGGARRRRPAAARDRPRRARRRHDPHAGGPGEGQGADRQGPAQGRQPGRGRRRRRGRSRPACSRARSRTSCCST